MDGYCPEFRTGIKTEAAGDTPADGEPGELVTHLIYFRTYLDAVIGAGNHTGGTPLATLRVDLDEVFFLSVHSDTSKHVIVKLTEIIYFFKLSGYFFRYPLNDQFMVGTAVFGADQNLIDAAGQVHQDGLPAAAAFIAAYPLGHQTDAAPRTMGFGDAVQVGLARQEAVKFIMAAPEGIDEHPSPAAADFSIKTDRRFAVQPHMLGHQAMTILAVQLLDDQEILALLLDVLDAFRQRREKFGGHLFVDKLHLLLLGNAAIPRDRRFF
jgi:hypothetical protein